MNFKKKTDETEELGGLEESEDFEEDFSEEGNTDITAPEDSLEDELLDEELSAEDLVADTGNPNRIFYYIGGGIIAIIILIFLMVAFFNRPKETIILLGQEIEMKLAAVDFYDNNPELLPENTKDRTKVYLSELIQNKYLNSIVDQNGDDCAEDVSYVEVLNFGNGEYGYYPYLFCDNYATSETFNEWSELDFEEQYIAPERAELDQYEKLILYNILDANNAGIPDDDGRYWEEWTLLTEEDLETFEEDEDYEYEYKTEYRYQDEAWIWKNNGGTNYTSEHYASAPSGYPTKVEGTEITQAKYAIVTREYLGGDDPELYFEDDDIPAGYPLQDEESKALYYKYESEEGRSYAVCDGSDYCSLEDAEDLSSEYIKDVNQSEAQPWSGDLTYGSYTASADLEVRKWAQDDTMHLYFAITEAMNNLEAWNSEYDDASISSANNEDCGFITGYATPRVCFSTNDNIIPRYFELVNTSTSMATSELDVKGAITEATHYATLQFSDSSDKRYKISVGYVFTDDYDTVIKVIESTIKVTDLSVIYGSDLTDQLQSVTLYYNAIKNSTSLYMLENSIANASEIYKSVNVNYKDVETATVEDFVVEENICSASEAKAAVIGFDMEPNASCMCDEGYVKLYSNVSDEEGYYCQKISKEIDKDGCEDVNTYQQCVNYCDQPNCTNIPDDDSKIRIYLDDDYGYSYLTDFVDQNICIDNPYSEENASDQVILSPEYNNLIKEKLSTASLPYCGCESDEYRAAISFPSSMDVTYNTSYYLEKEEMSLAYFLTTLTNNRIYQQIAGCEKNNELIGKDAYYQVHLSDNGTPLIMGTQVNASFSPNPVLPDDIFETEPYCLKYSGELQAIQYSDAIRTVTIYSKGYLKGWTTNKSEAKELSKYWANMVLKTTLTPYYGNFTELAENEKYLYPTRFSEPIENDNYLAEIIYSYVTKSCVLTDNQVQVCDNYESDCITRLKSDEPDENVENPFEGLEEGEAVSSTGNNYSGVGDNDCTAIRTCSFDRYRSGDSWLFDDKDAFQDAIDLYIKKNDEYTEDDRDKVAKWCKEQYCCSLVAKSNPDCMIGTDPVTGKELWYSPGGGYASEFKKSHSPTCAGFDTSSCATTTTSPGGGSNSSDSSDSVIVPLRTTLYSYLDTYLFGFRDGNTYLPSSLITAYTSRTNSAWSAFKKGIISNYKYWHLASGDYSKDSNYIDATELMGIDANFYDEIFYADGKRPGSEYTNVANGETVDGTTVRPVQTRDIYYRYYKPDPNGEKEIIDWTEKTPSEIGDGWNLLEQKYKYAYYKENYNYYSESWLDESPGGAYEAVETRNLYIWSGSGDGYSKEYYSEAPTGYPIKTDKSELTEWTEWSEEVPETETYRTIETRLWVRRTLKPEVDVYGDEEIEYLGGVLLGIPDEDNILDDYVTREELEQMLDTVIDPVDLGEVGIITDQEPDATPVDGEMLEQKQEVIFAAESYMDDREFHLPEKINESTKVYLNDLIKSGYLEDVYNDNNQICDSNLSYVEVAKVDFEEIEYYPYLFCSETIEYNLDESIAYKSVTLWRYRTRIGGTIISEETEETEEE